MLASVSKRSLTLPGLKSDWEIDPDELVIERLPDGTEWELGSGASARVRARVFPSPGPNPEANTPQQGLHPHLGVAHQLCTYVQLYPP